MAGTAQKAAVTAGSIVLLGALNAGCSANPSSPIDSGPTTGSGTSLVVSSVSNPLDASSFRDAPCRLIAAQQADELGLPFVEQELFAGRPTCTWRADQAAPNPLDALSIRFQSDSGVAAIAQQCENGPDCDSWTVDKISDYPVIRANGQLESKYGLCRLFVGIADNVAFLVTDGDLDAIRKSAAEGNAGGPRCDRADRAVAFAIQTLETHR